MSPCCGVLTFLRASLTCLIVFKVGMCQDAEAVTDTDADYSSTTFDYSEFSMVCEKEENRQFRRWFMPIFYPLICVVGLTGNLLVIVTFYRFSRLKTMTDVYLLNLAIADWLFALTLPFWAASLIAEWVLGLFLCKVMHTVYKVTSYCSMFLLSFISMDRYFAIAKAVSSHRRRSQAVLLSKVSSAVAWLMAMIFSIPEMTYTTINNHTCTPFSSRSDPLRIGIQTSQVVVAFMIPLLVMIVCYSSIAQTLYQARTFERNKAIKVILAVVVVFVVCQVPYNVVLFWSTMVIVKDDQTDCGNDNKLLYANDVTQCLAFLRCCLNPFLYVFIGVKFRYDLFKLLKEFGCLSQERFLKYTCGRKSSTGTNEPDTTNTF
ncbi:C-C chemokine receptor type 7-like [Neosynchiropus ocellatus]